MPSLEYGAEHFAANILAARACVRHHALGRGDDRHAETLTDLRDVTNAHVHPAAGLGDPLELANDGLAFVVLEADLDCGVAAVVLGFFKTADIAFVLASIVTPK